MIGVIQMLNIAIDGPCGAGKSTIAKRIAEELKIQYLDTGAMYRSTALHLINKNIDLDNDNAIITALIGIDIQLHYSNGDQHVFLEGKDVSNQIRSPQISKISTRIATLPFIRDILIKKQRDMATKKDLVLDGRDIGTNVLPNAEYKFFITASPEIRAKRIFNDLIKRGKNIEYEDVLSDVKYRDHMDTTREHGALKQADDAKAIDTSSLSINEVSSIIMESLK